MNPLAIIRPVILLFFAIVMGSAARAAHPDWTFTSGPGSANAAASVTYNFTIHDPDGDLTQAEVAWRTPSGAVWAIAPWFSIGGETGQYSFNYTVTFNQGSGPYEIWVNARDAEGNVRDPWADNIPGERLTVQVSSGNTAPDWTSTSGPATASPNSTVNYTFTIHDPDGNLSQAEVAWRTPTGAVWAIRPWFSIGGPTGQYTFTSPVTFNQGPGTYELWVNARDSYGLVRDPWAQGITPERKSITVTAPTPGHIDLPTTISSHSNGTTAGVTYSINDNGVVSGSQTYYHHAGGDPFLTYQILQTKQGPGYVAWVVRENHGSSNAGSAYYHVTLRVARYIRQTRSWNVSQIHLESAGGVYTTYHYSAGIFITNATLTTLHYETLVQYWQGGGPGSAPRTFYTYNIPTQQL